MPTMFFLSVGLNFSPMNLESENTMIEKVFIEVLKEMTNNEPISDIRGVITILKQFNEEGASNRIVEAWDLVQKHPLWLELYPED